MKNPRTPIQDSNNPASKNKTYVIIAVLIIAVIAFAYMYPDRSNDATGNAIVAPASGMPTTVANPPQPPPINSQQ